MSTEIAMPENPEWMTREEFMRIVREKALEKSHELDPEERDDFEYTCMKRAEAFWTEHGAPPKEASVEIHLEEKNGKKKVFLRVYGMEEYEVQDKRAKKGNKLVILVAGALSFVIFLILLYVFYFT